MLELYRHQKDLIDDAPDRHALVWSCGLGKSLALMELSRIKEKDTLLICPKGLQPKWREDIEEYGLMPKTQIITKETFRRDWAILPFYPTVAVDEGHAFLGAKSGLRKSLKAYFKKWNVPNRYFASATIYRSTPMDVYYLAELLGKPINYPAFFKRFFYEIRMGRRMIPKIKPDIEDEVAEIVKHLGSVIKTEDCMDVPPQIFKIENFELTKAQIQAMKDIPDITPIVRYTKHHQVASGSLKGDEYNEAKFFSSLKRDRLMELAEEHKRMIVVFRYNHDVDYFKDKLKKYDVRVINGAVEPEERNSILKELKDKKEYILLVNSMVYEGWELATCPLMVFYSMDYSLVAYIQMIGRIQRGNNLKKNVYLFLITKNTPDELVYESVVINKMSFHTAIYNK